MKKYIISLFLFGFLLVPAFSFASFDASLKYGSRGDDVIELQDFLQDQGVYSGTIDGRFGLGTRKAVIAFQVANGLKGDGYFGIGSRTKANSILELVLKSSTDAEQRETGTTTPSTSTTLPSEAYPTTSICASTNVKYNIMTGQLCSGTVMPPKGENGQEFKGYLNPTGYTTTQWGTHKLTIDEPKQCFTTPCPQTVSYPVSGQDSSIKSDLKLYENSRVTIVGQLTWNDFEGGFYGIVASKVIPSGGVIPTTPSITVISPNGGETFQTTQKITVRWKSNNINNSKVGITFINVSDDRLSFFLGDWVLASIGEQTFAIPHAVIPGKYKINISTPPESSSSSAEDYSDNFFTISSSTTITEDLGCPPGHIYSTKSGKLCTDLGCYGEKYSRTSGQMCYSNDTNRKGWSDFTSGGSGDHSAQIISDFFANPDQYGYNPFTLTSGQVNTGTKFLLRLYKSCSDSWIDRKEKIPLPSTYYNYTGSNRYQEHCINDGTFDNYYDEAIVSESTTTTTNPVISGITGPQTLNIGQEGKWTITASDASGGNLNYSVVWGDEGYQSPTSTTMSKSLIASQTATFYHTYSKSGVFSPTFTVTNDKGGSTKTSLSVNVGNSSNVSVSLVKNSGYLDSQIGVNTVNAKIGSFVLNNQSAQDIRVTSLRVLFSYDLILSTLRNLKVSKDGVQFGPTMGSVGSNNSIIMNMSLSAYSKSVIDVYADLGSSSISFATKLQATYSDNISNVGNTTEIATGQNITIVSSTQTNVKPVLNPSAVPGGNINVGQSTNFYFSATDADGDDLYWNITYSNIEETSVPCPVVNSQNKQGWTKNVSHSWSTAGTYNVKVMVSDCRGGTAETSFNVNVGNGIITPAVPVVSVSTSALSVAPGGSATISWTSTGNPSYCIFSGNGFLATTNGSSGSKTVSPTVTSTYTIDCYNTGGVKGSATATVYVNTVPTPAVPVVTVSAYPALIDFGSSSTITYSATNSPSYCTFIDGGINSTSGSTGTKVVSPTITTTYTVDCYNTGGVKGSGSTIVSIKDIKENVLVNINSSFKPGCTSTSNYSTTTGQPCR